MGKNCRLKNYFFFLKKLDKPRGNPCIGLVRNELSINCLLLIGSTSLTSLMRGSIIIDTTKRSTPDIATTIKIFEKVKFGRKYKIMTPSIAPKKIATPFTKL